jgi:selenocysteine lyase/cysteine desulfurase
MISNQKHLFDIPDEITYLACAERTPFLKTSRKAGIEGIDRKYHTWEINPAILTNESEVLRRLFASLIGATDNDIAIVPSTSYGVATAAKNLPLGKGRDIVILEDQFPSNVYAWQQLATEKQGNMVVVPRPEDWDWTSAVLEHITTTSDIVALPPCHWIDGSRLDLSVIGARCRDVGASFVIDATQAVGAMPIDVTELKPDYLLCSGYKWLFCPFTISFLYAAPHRQNDTPLEFHGQNKGFGQTADGHVDYHDGYLTGARRFDMAERNNFINMPIAITALEQVESWGPAEIQQTLSPLLTLCANEARARGWSAPDDDHRVGHYIGLKPGKPVRDDLAAFLKTKGIHVTQRGPGIRIAPHLFNTNADIHRLFEILDTL